MKRTISIVILIAACVGSWMYWHGDAKVKQTLIAQEWHSSTIAYMNFWDLKVASLDKAVITSTVKYLPNQTYLKNSTLTFSSDKVAEPIEITISEAGQWDLSDHYLIVDPSEFKDISTKPVTQISEEQVTELKKLFKISSQLSRKVDVVNGNTLLLTSLGHGSTLLYAQ